MKRLPPAVLALLLPLGLVVGFFAGRLSAPDPVPGVHGGLTARDAANPNRVSASGAARPAGRADRGAMDPLDASRSSVGGSLDAQARALAEQVVDALESEGAIGPADRILEGRVLDHLGRPFADADVVVQPVPERRNPARRGTNLGRAWDDRLSVLEIVESFALPAVALEHGACVARSAEDGTFSVAVPAAAAYTARAWAEGQTGDTAQAAPGAFLELTLQPIGLYHLEPRLPDGSLPESALVVEDPSGRTPREHRWTQDDPVIRLQDAAATLQLATDSEGRAPWSLGAGTFVGEPVFYELDVVGVGPHVVSLERHAKLRIRVTAEGPRASGWLPWVDVRHVGASHPEQLVREAFGAYVVPGHASGSYAVRVGHVRGEAVVERTVEVPREGLDVEVSLPALERAEHVIARCLDPNGVPLTGVAFAIEIEKSPRGRSLSSVHGLDQPRGETWIPWTKFEEYENPRARRLRAASARYGEILLPVERAGQELVFAFEPRADVTVVLVGDTVERLRVKTTPATERTRRDSMTGTWHESTTDAEGRAMLGRFQPGPYVLRIPDPEKSDTDVPLVAEVVEFVPGPQTLEFTLPGRASLEVQMPEEALGKYVHLAAASGGLGETAHVPDEGLVVFEDVLEGEYRLSYGKGGARHFMAVTVPGPRVRFESQPVRGYEVRDEPGSGPFVGEDLRAGDLILGTGALSASEPAFWNRARDAVRAGPVTFRVERNGRVHSVQVQAEEGEAVHWSFDLRTTPRLR